MDWFVFAANVPGPIELGTLGWVSVVALAAALAPLGLVARHVLGFATAEPERTPLRRIESGRQLSQRVA